MMGAGYPRNDSSFPPIFGALANALYKTTGKRVYRQPFLGEKQMLG